MNTDLMWEKLINSKEEIELYARAYNTIQEMIWTFYDENIQKENIKTLWKVLESLDEYIHESEEFTDKEKEQYNILTDNIHDRIYFNCYKPWENERQ